MSAAGSSEPPPRARTTLRDFTLPERGAQGAVGSPRPGCARRSALPRRSAHQNSALKADPRSAQLLLSRPPSSPSPKPQSKSQTHPPQPNPPSVAKTLQAMLSITSPSHPQAHPPQPFTSRLVLSRLAPPHLARAGSLHENLPAARTIVRTHPHERAQRLPWGSGHYQARRHASMTSAMHTALQGASLSRREPLARPTAALPSPCARRRSPKRPSSPPSSKLRGQRATPAEAHAALTHPPDPARPPPRRAQAGARSSRAGRARIVRVGKGVPRPSTGEHGAEPDVWGRRDARRTRRDRTGWEGRSAAEHGTVGAPAGGSAIGVGLHAAAFWASDRGVTPSSARTCATGLLAKAQKSNCSGSLRSSLQAAPRARAVMTLSRSK
jgi:hypothetical protein